MKSQNTNVEVDVLEKKDDIPVGDFLFIPDNLFIFKPFEVSNKNSDKND